MFRSECAGNYSSRTIQKGEMGMARPEKEKKKDVGSKKACLSINLAELPLDQHGLKKKKKLFACVNVSRGLHGWKETLRAVVP